MQERTRTPRIPSQGVARGGDGDVQEEVDPDAVLDVSDYVSRSRSRKLPRAKPVGGTHPRVCL